METSTHLIHLLNIEITRLKATDPIHKLPNKDNDFKFEQWRTNAIWSANRQCEERLINQWVKYNRQQMGIIGLIAHKLKKTFD